VPLRFAAPACVFLFTAVSSFTKRLAARVHAEEGRTTLFVNDGLALLLDVLRRFRWDQELVSRGMWALSAMSVSHGTELLKLDGLEVANVAMDHNIKHYQTILHFVKLVKNLLAVDGGISQAKNTNIVALLRTVITNNDGDGMLLWRVNGLLKSLSQEQIASSHDVLQDFDSNCAALSP
jgi:hypothetical protein